MSSDETPVVHIKRMEVYVEDCSSIYLLDEGRYEASAGPDDSLTHSIGLIEVEGKGIACLNIATQWGVVDFTVAVADRDPGTHFDGYEDIVEISFESLSGELLLVGWHTDWDEKKVHNIPPLPVGPGTYRLRYHTQGDAESWSIDGYYLQIWPAPQHDPAVLKTTSYLFQYLLSPEAWEPQ
ncbi:hypothetical protein Ppa06_24080 [Planomonospora parontospora subsp. parontospora]|uniref:Uncharacterized protein n=2 Tax=Planomonospora parontospora TaxID=58119 RepID=A0AA37BF84_9ACTN|nr:hypothetical protein [Planomonospora parontospora]GGK61907.1 hypothetical protein GCM10010126_21600 [Planomonospora parontospora]GII08610.1 hypothetical protein Ppa06_24080 [Planomonospora parontospora subsp. parontospora]